MHTKREDSLSNRDSKEKKLDQYGFEGDSSTLRQRRPNLNNFPETQPNLTERDNNSRLDIFSLRQRTCLAIFLIGLIGLIGLIYYVQFGQNGNDSRSPFGRDYENFPRPYKESDLASFRMNKVRVALRNLGVVMAKSDIIVQSGHSIAKVLFSLDEEVQDTGDKLNDFSHQSDKFFWTISSEMKAIEEAIKQETSSLFEFLSDDAANFVRMRLSKLDGQISPLQNKLNVVIQAILKIQKSANNAQGYLVDGEREAQQTLEKHWKGNIADYTERKRAESELVQIRFTLKMFEDIAPNLISFESFLKMYRLKIQDLTTEIKGIPKKLTVEDTKYVKKAVAVLEEQYAQFNSAVKKLGSKPVESYYIEDEMNSKNRDCTEFRALLKRSNAYLKTIKIWSSEVVNAIAFIYTDDTTELYGLPNDRDPYIFDWHDNEKIKCVNIRIGAVLYAIQFETNQGRVSDWVGGNNNKGNTYVVYSALPSIGIHGSFSRQICSIGIISH